MAVQNTNLVERTQNATIEYAIQQQQESKQLEELDQRLEDTLMKLNDWKVNDSTPGEIAGNGTDAEPYLIESIEDLVELSNEVAGGKTYDGAVVKLEASLDFSLDNSYAKTQEEDGTADQQTMKNTLTTGNGFSPIGTNDHQFNGTFDGGNHEIKNLYIKQEEGTNPVGLFGYAGEQSNIKNIKITNPTIIVASVDYVGGVAGRSQGTIENAKAEGGEITASIRYVGGIVGEKTGGTVSTCSNSTKVTGNRSIGGIIGQANNTTIDKCTNKGTITGNGIYNEGDNQYHVEVGGIVGTCISSEINNCNNKGKVSMTKMDKNSIEAGGIAGWVTNNSTIYMCYNDANIGALEESMTQVGGIAGGLNQESVVSACYNLGEISGNHLTGGIIGYGGWKSTFTVENCYNKGAVNGNRNIAGICVVDSYTLGTTIKNCYNTGNVNLQDNMAGGIISITGTVEATITNCYYLSGTATHGIYPENVEGATEKQESEMQNEEFVNDLNTGNETEVWKMDESNSNGGYPVLK